MTREQTNADQRYNVVVRWSEIDNLYLAEVSEFPGVSGYGASRDEAVQQVEHALKLALETHAEHKWEPPKPAALGASGQFRLRLPRQLHARLSAAAMENGVSLNQFVVSLIAEALARAEQLPKNAFAELREWFDATLQVRLHEVVNESRGQYIVPEASHILHAKAVIARRKPFESPSKWAPLGLKHGYLIPEASEETMMIKGAPGMQKKPKHR